MAAVTLFKFFKRKEQSIGSSLLTSKDIESADRAVAKALEAASKEVPRGKYNSYTDKQRAELGKYSLDNGPTTAAKHHSKVLTSMNQLAGD